MKCRSYWDLKTGGYIRSIHPLEMIEDLRDINMLSFRFTLEHV